MININQTLVPKDADYYTKIYHKDLCPHISYAYTESNETYFFGANAIFYCKLCKKEYILENGVPE